MKTNKNGVKLLAAIMAFAMVFVAGFAVIGGDESSVDALTGENIKYFSGTLDGYNEVPDKTVAYIDKDTTIVSVDSNNSGTITYEDKIGSIVVRSGGYLKINSGVTLTIENKTIGTLSDGGSTISLETPESMDFGGLIIEKGAYVVIDGKVVVKNGGTIYNDGEYKTTNTKVQNIYNGVYVNNSVTVEKGGEITGKGAAFSTDPPIANQMIVGAAGSVVFKSTSATPSLVSNQTFSIITGGSVDIDANVKGPVLVGSFTNGTDYKIPSYVVIATEENLASNDTFFWVAGAAAQVTDPATSNAQADVGSVDLQFSVTDRKADKLIINSVPTSKYTCAVLDVSGAVGENALLATLDNQFNDGTHDAFVADKDGVSTDIYAYGITEISKSLDIGKGAYFATIGKSNVIISGDLIIDGAKGADNKANVVMAGLHTVTGTIKIGSVNAYTSGSPDAWLTTGDGYNADATVNFFIYKDGCYINVEGDGEVSITDYDPSSFGPSEYGQMPDGTHGVSWIDSDDVFHITNLAQAIAGDNEDEITINSFAKRIALIDAHDFVISVDTILPEITVNVHGTLVIKDGVSLTIPEGADITVVDGSTGNIVVKGYLYDYTVSKNGFDGVGITADVRAIDADETHFLYTSMKNALSTASEGDSIELFGNVEIEKDLTVPAGVTILTKDKYIAVYPDVKLTIEGTVVIQEGGRIVLVKADADAKIGSIENKNIIVGSIIYKDVAANIATTNTEAAIPGIYATGTIGDYDTNNTSFILNPAVAAENSLTLADMEVKAKTTYTGALILKAAEGTTPVLDIQAETVFGEVTLEGWKIIIDDDTATDASTTGILTATIIAQTSAGESSVKFDKVSSNNVAIAVDIDDSGDEPVDYLKLTTGTTTLKGSLAIVSGEVVLNGTFTVGSLEADKSRSVMTINDGAKFTVPDGQKIVVNKKATTTDYAGLVVKGTLAIVEGDLETTALSNSSTEKSGRILVEGTLFISDVSGLDIDGTVDVQGTFSVDTAEDTKASVSIDSGATMIVGKAPETLGGTPTVIGVLSVAGTLTVYPGADMSGALINVGDDGVSTAKKLDLMIEGQVYMTSYTTNGEANITDLIPKSISLPGYETIKNDSTTCDWYVNEKLTTSATGKKVADYSVAYAKTTVSQACVLVSVGSGMSLWIDGVKYTTGDKMMLNVGEYNVEVTINPGYKGTTKVTFDGVQVTNGKIVITPEMSITAPVITTTTPIVLSATGEISIDTGDTPAPVQPTEKDDGMGITDYLLIVLVVLAAILVVIVAIRMMRS